MDYRVFPRLYFFFILVNIGFLFVNSGLGITAQTPFGADNTNFTSVQTPNFFNGTNNTGTLTANMTDPSQTGTNSTGDPVSFDWFTDYIEVSLNALQFLWLLVSGGFLGNFILQLGAPDYFVTGIYTIVGFLTMLWIAYQILGKG